MKTAESLLVLTMLTGWVGLGFGQSTGGAAGDPAKDAKTMSVTGCLGPSTGHGASQQFILKSGEMSYELDPGGVNLAPHVGHKVTIDGRSMRGQGPHDEDRIRVTKLTMISATCT